eukprot:CAMPEP_0117440988 /NCGR_PEP_ID=MMETSP0759-20121206/3385_1 /TAXON_ID=63605 /ORGANISM="Percolomonas cosmopolitus, Strain WS" /LENGTH=327 /DNA_ID=CAMNT_0005232793 /DNA_START=144 /DNA_END=1127 /DNA_ORIENTATION=+
MAVDTQSQTFVTASQDHSLKVFNYSTSKLQRTLYTSRYGHQEWVTTVDYASNGQIVSGGMDSKICVWDAVSARCQDLHGHRGSISKIKCSESQSVMISSSYDKTLKVWDVDRCTLVHTLKNTKYGHQKAVHSFLWPHDSALVVSGGRDGLGCVWDINSAKMVSTLDEHSAPLTSMQLFEDGSSPLIITGGMDGYVCVWDSRSSQLVEKVDVIASVNDIAAFSNGLVVGGTDKLLRVIDPRTWSIRLQLKGHKDVVYQVKTVPDSQGDLIFSSGGNGWVLVHDSNTGKCLYGVGACENGACNCIEVVPPKHFIAAGDDGKVIIFDYHT